MGRTFHFCLGNLFGRIPRYIELCPLDYFQMDTTSARVIPLVYGMICNGMNQREAQEMAGMPGMISQYYYSTHMRMLVREVLRYEKQQHRSSPTRYRLNHQGHLTIQRFLYPTTLLGLNQTNRPLVVTSLRENTSQKKNRKQKTIR